MLVINFKTYPELTGKNGLERVKLCQKVTEETGVEIIIGVQATDIYQYSQQSSIPVFGQDCSPYEPGRHTGFTLPFSLKQAGAKGVFLNHSEKPIKDFNLLKETHILAKKAGLKTLVFVKDIDTALKADQLKPDYLALEEPSLVSKTAMVKYPKFNQLIKEFSAKVKSLPILGAGVRTKKDVLASLKLGVKGVAFASEFAYNKNPEKLLLDFASCFN
jgi:triosephosphate isomerase